jgi:hypothetical protein
MKQGPIASIDAATPVMSFCKSVQTKHARALLSLTGCFPEPTSKRICSVVMLPRGNTRA